MKSEKRKRERLVPAFGAILSDARGKMSLGTVVNLLAAAGIDGDRSTLWQYEQGTVLAPDPVVLGGLAEIYGASLQHWLLVLRWNRKHLKKDQAPGLVALREGEQGMRITGIDETLVRRFRELTNDQQQHVLRMVEFEAAARGAAEAQAATFRKTRR